MRLIPNRQAGFSLIELMVAMVVGLIVAGGAISLSVSHIRNNTLVVSSTRLTQETRALTEIIGREVRRARMNANALSRVGAGSTSPTFEVLATPSADCIQYAYDADLNGVAGAGEFRSISRNANGQLLLGRFDTAAAITCFSGTVLNSPEVQVSSLSFQPSPVLPGTKLIGVNFQTHLAADPNITRWSTFSVRVRSASVP